LFAGISLEGSTIRPDNKPNQHVHAKYLAAKAIVLSDQVRVPATADQLVSALEANTAHHKPEMSGTALAPKLPLRRTSLGGSTYLERCMSNTLLTPGSSHA
jgi:hypothetical protein